MTARRTDVAGETPDELVEEIAHTDLHVRARKSCQPWDDPPLVIQRGA